MSKSDSDESINLNMMYYISEFMDSSESRCIIDATLVASIYNREFGAPLEINAIACVLEAPLDARLAEWLRRKT